MNSKDRGILRRLAHKQRQYADTNENLSKIKRWFNHNAMQNKPMVLAEICGIIDEIGFESHLECEDALAREIELVFKQNFYMHEYIRDDSVIDPYYKILWDITDDGYGVPMGAHRSKDRDGKEWGMEINPPIRDIEKDLLKLRHRNFKVDKEKTLNKKIKLESIFGDILPIRIYGDYWWTMGLSHHAIYFTGLEEYMMLMYDQPEALHELMEFIYDDRMGMIRWLEAEGLLCLNNNNNYIGSGSRGFTDELSMTGNTVKSRELWVLLESQPTGYVSPEMFSEFVLDYQLRVAKEFGLVYYGCCEPLHDRMDLIKQIPNLKSVSVSPFSNEEVMARELGRDYIYSRKPDPAMLSLENFNEQSVKDSTEYTLRTAKGCELEFIMKDLHTVRYEPKRLKKWVEVTRRTIESH